MFAKKIWLAIGLSCILPYTFASTCADLTVEISQDIQKGNLNSNLKWMNLSWLKKQLGPSKKKFNEAGALTYNWVCPERNNSYLSFTVDNDGKMIGVAGIYSNDSGSAMFEANRK